MRFFFLRRGLIGVNIIVTAFPGLLAFVSGSQKAERTDENHMNGERWSKPTVGIFFQDGVSTSAERGLRLGRGLITGVPLRVETGRE